MLNMLNESIDETIKPSKEELSSIVRKLREGTPLSTGESEQYDLYLNGRNVFYFVITLAVLFVVTPVAALTFTATGNPMIFCLFFILSFFMCITYSFRMAIHRREKDPSAYLSSRNIQSSCMSSIVIGLLMVLIIMAGESAPIES